LYLILGVGHSDWEPRRFQIDDAKISASHFADEKWQRAWIAGEKTYSVKGIMVYSLNNVKLICPLSVREKYRDMLRFVPWNQNYDRKKAIELKRVSTQCQPFTQGGITRLSE